MTTKKTKSTTPKVDAAWESSQHGSTDPIHDIWGLASQLERRNARLERRIKRLIEQVQRADSFISEMISKRGMACQK